MIKQVRRDNMRRKLAKDPIEYFNTGRVFVSAEPDEDLTGIAALVGEDSFVLGSDYPHGDPSRQEDMVAELENARTSRRRWSKRCCPTIPNDFTDSRLTSKFRLLGSLDFQPLIEVRRELGPNIGTQSACFDEASLTSEAF